MNSTKKILILFLITCFFCSCFIIRYNEIIKSFSLKSLSSKNFRKTINFRRDKNYIYVNAKVNGIQNEYILDTGAPCTFFLHAKKNLNLKSKPVLLFGKNKFSYGYTNIDLNGIEYKNVTFLLLNPYSSFNASGLLGSNLMHNLVWNFNFCDSTITISDQIINFDLSKYKYFTPLKHLNAQKSPYIEVIVNKSDTLNVLIDTGDPSFIFDFNKRYVEQIKSIEKKDIKECLLIKKISDLDTKSVTSISKFYINIRSLKIGTLELNNLIAINGISILGLNFIQNFNLIIDWINSVVYLNPNNELNLINNIYTVGFKILKFNNKLYVNYLIKESKANELGVKLGDEILSINGIPYENVTEELIKNINSNDDNGHFYTFNFKKSSDKITLKKENLY